MIEIKCKSLCELFLKQDEDYDDDDDDDGKKPVSVTVQYIKTKPMCLSIIF